MKPPYSTFLIALTSPVMLTEGTPTGCRCRRGKISVALVNGSGTTGWLYQTLEQPGKTRAVALGLAALPGAARRSAFQPNTGRTNCSAWLGHEYLETRRRRRRGLRLRPGRVRRRRRAPDSSPY